MTDEINDYAPALLKIKAAIKELETQLPQRDWMFAELQMSRVQDAAKELRAITSREVWNIVREKQDAEVSEKFAA